MGKNVTFLIATQADKGSHKNIVGLTQRVNSHSAAFNHAKKRHRKKVQQLSSKPTEYAPHRAEPVNQEGSFQATVQHATTVPVTLFIQPHESRLDLPNTQHVIKGLSDEQEQISWPSFNAVQPMNDVSSLYGSYPRLEEWEVDSHNTNSDKSSCSTSPDSSTSLHLPLSRSEPALRRLNEIPGKLDPFIRLPVELSAYERNLLHYFMSEGRRMICGTSGHPKYDYFLNIACRQMETCPFYALSRITTAEVMILKLTDGDHLIEAYKRAGIMYNMARCVASDEHMSLQARISMLINLTLTEGVLQRQNFKIIHLQELDRLIANNGGMGLFFQGRHDGTAMVEPYFLLTLYTWGDAPGFTEYFTFHKAMRGLIDMLRNVRHWVLSLHRLRDAHDDESDYKHQRLAKYLYFILETYLSKPGHNALDEGPKTFILLLNICMTFVELDCNRTRAANLLFQLQKCMAESVTTTTVSGSTFEKVAATADLGDDYDLHPLHPSQVLGLLCHMRREFPHGTNNAELSSKFNIREEIKMCSISIDAAKLYRLLSVTTQVRLAGEFFKCITSVSLRGGFMNCLDEVVLDDLKAELEESWYGTVADQKLLHQP